MSKPSKEYVDLQTPFTEKTHGKMIGWLFQQKHEQTAAADAATALLWVASFDGQIGDLYIMHEALAAADEEMSWDVLKNGTTVLSAPLIVDDTFAVNKQISLMHLVLSASISFVIGDVFRVTRDYTAGGAPTPIGANGIVLEPTTHPYMK